MERVFESVFSQVFVGRNFFSQEYCYRGVAIFRGDQVSYEVVEFVDNEGASVQGIDVYRNKFCVFGLFSIARVMIIFIYKK